MSGDLTDLSLIDARQGLMKGEFTALELTDACLAAMDRLSHLNAFITTTHEIARTRAKAADSALRSGNVGVLTGLPVAIKDLFCTEGILTTAASHILDGFKPPYESTVTMKIWQSGAVMLGKTNLDEFAMGSSNETSYYGGVVNPWTPKGAEPLVPGGSSGGSAAAVAARLCPAATGTDTGGSIRQPAAFCGIVGLKPTYGRCSRRGIVAFASSLDQAGPMTRTVEDAALMLRVMAGHDEHDSTSARVPVDDFLAAVREAVEPGLKIGIPKEYRTDGLSDEISALWDQGAQWLTDAGAEVREISLPHTRFALPTYYIVAPAEASSNLARYDGVRYGLRVPADSLDEMYAKTRGEGFGAEVRRRVMIGTYVLSAGYYDAYYLKAQKVRRLILQDFERAFDDVDVILTPTAPSAAFAAGAKADPLSMYLNDVFTVPASLAGLPAISVPAGLSGAGLPLGLQLIGPSFAERTLLRVAKTLETAAAFSAVPPMVAGDAA